MSSFGKSTNPRHPVAPRNSGDYIPLLSMRRGSRNLNPWGTDNGDNDLMVGSEQEKPSTEEFLGHSNEIAPNENAVCLQSLFN